MYTEADVKAKIEKLKAANRKAAHTKRGMNIENRAAVDRYIAGNRSKIERLALNFNIANDPRFCEQSRILAAEKLLELMK